MRNTDLFDKCVHPIMMYGAENAYEKVRGKIRSDIRAHEKIIAWDHPKGQNKKRQSGK